MRTEMEDLLHFTWKHRLLPAGPLYTQSGQELEVIDPGLHNHHAGPDFFGAKVRIGGLLWAGSVEIHERASDWMRHGHHTDPAYDNVVLHVASEIDCDVKTQSGLQPEQFQLGVPPEIIANYEELRATETYPPCYRIIPHLPQLKQHAWLSALTTERLAEKTQRVETYLQRYEGDWERAAFIMLARNFGFGVNSDAFEAWAETIALSAVGKHRDNALQVEAFFFGQAGLLEKDVVVEERQDDYFQQLRAEYEFLRNKFSLQPVDPHSWKFLRMRPQNFPHIRLSQLTDLYCRQAADFSRLVGTRDTAELQRLLTAQCTPYWETHYSFGTQSARRAKTLQRGSIDLLVINTVAPLLFAYGRAQADEELCERAFCLLESTRAERNYITRSWEAAGIRAAHAADSQALYRLKNAYCDRRDCLRCRFGAEYLRYRHSL